MKKVHLTFLLASMFLMTGVQAQTVNASYINPTFTSTSYEYLRFGNSTNNWGGFMHNISSPYYGNGDDFTIFTYTNRDLVLRAGAGNIVLHPQGSGKVGIGTTSPTTSLDVRRSLASAFQIGTGGDAGRIFSSYLNSGTALILYDLDDFTSIRFRNGVESSSDNEAFLGAKNGNMGIGTFSPDYTLDVNGTLRAKEVRVQTGWSDHVFLADYKLPSLQEEKDHIKDNGHLLGFESEEAMGGEAQLGEITNRQQAKIEEMMLHLINLNERLSKVEAENERLKAQLANSEK